MAAEDSDERSNSARRVLVADDSVDIRRMLQFHLEDEGWEFIEAANGAEAIEKVLVEQPDMMILDVMMPEINGWEVIKYIRQKEMIAHTPVLMLTGIGAELNEMTSPLFGADAYLDKPVNLDQLDAKIEEALTSSRKRTAGAAV